MSCCSSPASWGSLSAVYKAECSPPSLETALQAPLPQEALLRTTAAVLAAEDDVRLCAPLNREGPSSRGVRKASHTAVQRKNGIIARLQRVLGKRDAERTSMMACLEHRAQTIADLQRQLRERDIAMSDLLLDNDALHSRLRRARDACAEADRDMRVLQGLRGVVMGTLSEHAELALRNRDRTISRLQRQLSERADLRALAHLERECAARAAALAAAEYHAQQRIYEMRTCRTEKQARAGEA